MKKTFILLLLSIIIYANEVKTEINFEYIKSLEKGLERDFYINEFLKKEITPDEAYNSLSLINNMNTELFFNFAKKYRHDETIAVAQCMKMSTKELVKTYSDCIVAGLSTKELSSLTTIDFDLIKQKIGSKYPNFIKKIKVLSSAIPFTRLITQNKDDFYDIFLNVDNDFRENYFNYKLPKRTFDKIFEDKNKFNDFLEVSLSNKKLNLLNNSLATIDDKELNFNSSFFLGLNSIRLNDLNRSYEFFNNALKKSNSQFNTDKINFWLFKITKDETYINQLSQSNELNFYSYLANEILKKNISSSIKLTKIENIKALEKKLDKTKIALLYALAETKSNFDSTKISKNFEIGLLQLKPNLINSIGNLLNQEYDIVKQFDIDENINYANIHISNILLKYKNPLFISFAYDNKVKPFQRIKKDNYEPYFSLEFKLNNDLEEKKNFLMYYVLYFNSLTKKSKEKISLESICQNLLAPDHKQDE